MVEVRELEPDESSRLAAAASRQSDLGPMSEHAHTTFQRDTGAPAARPSHDDGGQETA